jgi:hypothetical protein
VFEPISMTPTGTGQATAFDGGVERDRVESERSGVERTKKRPAVLPHRSPCGLKRSGPGSARVCAYCGHPFPFPFRGAFSVHGYSSCAQLAQQPLLSTTPTTDAIGELAVRTQALEKAVREIALEAQKLSTQIS